VTEPSHAVFLSYASQDAEAAQRICEALRAASIEVWFDQSALRGGDVWDQMIRKQIRTCVLFIPVISRHTHERDEGYFRLEWKLAVDRSHLMTTNKAFLLPVVIDNTREDDENVPDRFKDVHWTRLPEGETPPAFVERVRRLASPPLSQGPTTVVSPAGPVPTATLAVGATFLRPKRALLTIAAIVVSAALAYFAVVKFSKHPALPPTPPAVPASVPTAAFAPPPHSIAVLPFVNMSGDKEQEYFSDGLSEELLNSLARINELQVAARTSSFYFKGEHADLATIAHRLNVASVLEGSVRRSGHMVRVTAQLNNAVTGYHLWSQTYDRNLQDVLQVQTEVANAVAAALKVTLLGDVATKVELGGTRNPAAFDAYLRGSRALNTFNDGQDLQAAVAAFAEAIRLDPNYALAHAGRSQAYADYAGVYASGPAVREGFGKAHADARQAITLAPDLAEGHHALAGFFESSLDFRPASEEFERAVTLAPGNAGILDDYGRFAVFMGRADAGIAAVRRAVALDPLNPVIRRHLGQALNLARRNDDSVTALREAVALDPDSATNRSWLGVAYYVSGDFQSARSSCEIKPEFQWSHWCLALTYDRLGRRADAAAELAKFRAELGDSASYQYAAIHAQWGDVPTGLEWLETAMRLRDPGLMYVKTDPLLDPLRKEPRFQAIERELKFPN